MRLFLVRHPKPIGAETICYGQSDLDVTNHDLNLTAAAVKALFVDKTINLLLSSPLTRCRKLADKLSDSLGIEPTIEDRLIEMDFGDWEGLRWDEIDQQAFEAWSANYVDQTAPGGESFGDVLHRVQNLLEDLKQQQLETIAIVAHAGVIRAFLAVVLELPLEATWHFSVNYGTFIELEVSADQWRNRLVGMVQQQV